MMMRFFRATLDDGELIEYRGTLVNLMPIVEDVAESSDRAKSSFLRCSEFAPVVVRFRIQDNLRKSLQVFKGQVIVRFFVI